jgi:hypothetical protein
MRTASATPDAGARSTRRTASGKTRRTQLVRRYRDADGSSRELIARPGAEGTVLVVDRDVVSRSAERLVAHLSADEPFENIEIACRVFLAAQPEQRRCRSLAPADAHCVPFGTRSRDAGSELEARGRAALHGGATSGFRLALVPSGMSIPALRWTRCAQDALAPATVSLREAIATLESYEPLREMTRSALARYEHDPSVSCTVVRAELLRVLDSPIVLNRALREAVVAKVASGEASMSELAIRCGRLKRESGGGTTGETSWLARRVGLLPEGGHRRPTRWVHSDVLALIARAGLGVAPREVELG